MARLIFRTFQCEMELDYIIISRLLLAPVAKGLWKHWELVSVNLSEFILAAVLHSAALCIRLRNILGKWYVTILLTLPICPAISHNFVRIFCDDSEAILSRVSALCLGSQTFPSEKHLEEFANHIHLVKMI